jgi:hypothetical protein
MSFYRIIYNYNFLQFDQTKDIKDWTENAKLGWLDLQRREGGFEDKSLITFSES